MVGKTRVGFIGVGLMGHGMAKNLIEKGGYPLAVLGNRNRQPIDDLVRRGAREAKDPADIARSTDVVVLCLPSSAEAQAVIYGERGLMSAMKRGGALIDATTADPIVTRQIGADLSLRGVAMLDAALGRSPREAEDGRLSTYVGGEGAVLERLRPILACYADTIVHCGPLGAGTTCKLINNSISLGMATLISEAFSTAAKAGVDLAALCDVLSAGGVDGRMWRMMEPWIRSRDDSGLKAPLRIAAKDLSAYGRLAEDAGSAVPVAQAVSQTLRLALNSGHKETFLPALPGVLAALNGAKIG